MNTRPPSQHEILDDEERELARVVRALPGGEPPAALDALILKAATDAVASSQPQKRSFWGKGLLGTSALWMGTAAASILTVGIGWQVFQSMRAPIYELPDNENVRSAQVIDQHDKDESLTVEMTPAREPAPASPPPPEAFPESDQLAEAAADMPAMEKPAPMAPEKREQVSKQRQEMADAALAKASDDKGMQRRDQAAEMVAAPQAAAAPPAPPAPTQALAGAASDSEREEVDSVTVTGSRIKRSVEEEGHVKRPLSYNPEKLILSIDEESTLKPELWLDAIKDRVKRKDIDGAKASLKRFREIHPKHRIPEELLPLLK
ncbi:MAG: hypothetical protein ACREO1_04385 [Arenimonas sp.]